MSNSIPQISILMPVFNAHKYILKSIKSILDQSFTAFELIICDDASTDGSLEIIEEMCSVDSRIKVYKNHTNLGIAATRNKLLSLASAPYLAWQDADDISMPSRLSEQKAYLDTHPLVGICGAWLEFFSDKASSTIRKYAEVDSDLRKNIFRYSPVAQPVAMLRTQAIKSVGLYDLNYPPAEDLDMSFRIGRSWQFANIQKPLLRYREHLSSATYLKLKQIELSTISIRLRYNNSGYTMTFPDHVYNIAQYITSLFIPSSLKLRLFKLLRNSKK